MPIGSIAGAEYVANTGDAASRACAIPAGTADGDLLIAYAVLSQDDTATAIAGPGFTAYPFAQVTSIGRTAVLARRWNTGDPTSFTFTKVGSSNAGTFAVVMIKVPGAAWTAGSGFAVAPVKTDQGGQSTAVNCPASVVPAGLTDNALVVRFFHTYYFSAPKNSTDTWTPPSGFTERADQSDDWCSIGAATLLRGAGTEAASAATAGGSTTGAFGRGVSLVVAPSSAQVAGGATLAATSGLSADATTTSPPSSATLVAASNLTGIAQQTHRPIAALTAASALAADGRPVRPAVAALSATSTLLSAADRVKVAAAVMAAGSSLDIGAVLRTAGVRATLAAVHGLNATARSTQAGQLNISVWAVDRANGNRRVPLPHHMKLTVADIDAQAGTVAFDYPVRGKNFWLLNRDVAGDSDLEVEVWLGGRASTALRGYLNQREGDEVDERGVVRFTGALMNSRFDEAQVQPQAGNEKAELVFSNATPGAAMLFLLAQAQGRTPAALTDITVDFTALVDSNGVPWAETFSGKWSPSKTSYLQILQKLNTLGLLEWELTAGKVWRLYNFGGRGTDRTTGRTVMLRRGSNVVEANRRASSRDGGTTLFLDGAEGLFARYTDSTALARRGRVVEVSASAGNIAEQSALNATAQQLGGRIGKGVTERTFGLAFGVGHPRPGIHFGLGDLVLVETSGVRGSERVAQIQLDADAGGLSGSAVCGNLIADRAAALEARLAEQANGGVTVGTSTPSQNADSIAPGAPTGLTATSRAYQDEANGDTYARVDVGWLAPTVNADGDNDPRVLAAGYILERYQNLSEEAPIFEDWTWYGAPDVVEQYNSVLLALYPGAWDDTDAVEAWLSQFIADNDGPSSAATDVAGYQVRYAYLGTFQVGGIPSSEPWAANLLWFMATPEGGVRNTSFSFGGVGAGAATRIQVRAFDNSANFGVWSAPVDLTTAVDNTPPPQLAAPIGRVWFRTLDVTTTFIGSAGEPMPFDTDRVEVWLSRAALFDVPEEASSPVQFDAAVTTPQHVVNLGPSAGTWNQPDLQTGVGWYAAVRAVDTAGNAGLLSAIVGPFTAERLVGDDLINEIIDATKLSPNSVQNQHVVNLAVTSGKMADLAVIRAKIADLAVNNAKVEDVQAGKVTTGTLVATVTLTGLIQTAPSGLRWVGDPAGIRFYNASGDKTIDLQGASGNTLITGQLQSGLTGERWVMMQDGTLRLYPAAGSNYSQINNLGSDIMIRGPVDANQRSGRVNVNNQGAGINFSAESEIPNNLRSEIALQDRYAKIIAPLIEFKVDGRRTAPDGFERRILIKQSDGSGNDIGGSTMHWIYVTSGSGPTWVATQRDVGLKFGNTNNNNTIGGGRLYVTDAAGGAFRPIQASDFIPGSSVDLKDDVKPARAVLPDLLAVIRAAPSKAWKYKWEQYVTPLPTAENPNPQPVPNPAATEHFGPIAEDLPSVLKVPFTDPTGGSSIGVSLTSQIGVLWGALGQLQEQQIVSTSGRVTITELLTGIPAGGSIERTIQWDSAPPSVPTGGFATVTAALTLLGRCTAWIKTGSVTSKGCTVVIKNVSATPLVILAGVGPLTVEAVGLGLYSPPYQAAA